MAANLVARVAVSDASAARPSSSSLMIGTSCSRSVAASSRSATSRSRCLTWPNTRITSARRSLSLSGARQCTISGQIFADFWPFSLPPPPPRTQNGARHIVSSGAGVAFPHATRALRIVPAGVQLLLVQHRVRASVTVLINPGGSLMKNKFESV
jgi:hypothetical protein